MNIEDYNLRKDLSRIALEGKDYMRTKSVVICTMVKNAEQYIHATMQTLRDIGECFNDYHIIVYENDSTDKTRLFLKELTYGPNFTLMSEDLGLPNLGSGTDAKRLETMAMLRNKYLDIVKKEHTDKDYVVVMDGDIAGVDLHGLQTSFGLNIDWDAMTSNGLDPYMGNAIYYDILTLVQDGKIQNNLARHALNYPTNQLIKVESAFGGLAIYKMDAIQNAKYESFAFPGVHCSWHPDMRACCEHTGLCLSMAKDGHDKIFINPNQVIYRT